ncbi:MAG: hypothetical protein ACN6O7_18915 [Sphingobacterium sp.]
MWKHFIFLFAALLLSFKNLNANKLVLKSDSVESQFLSSKNSSKDADHTRIVYFHKDHSQFFSLYPSLQSIVAEMDVEVAQDWLMDRWLVTVDLLWHELLPFPQQKDYRYEHTLDLAPIPIARFLLFEQIKIPC